MRLRRHHNNDGRRQIQQGTTADQVEHMANRLLRPMPATRRRSIASATIYPDPEYESYLWATWLHAEAHYDADSDPELCDDFNCPYSVSNRDPDEEWPA